MAEVENEPNYGKVPRWGKAGPTDPDSRAGYQKKDDAFSGYKAVTTINERAWSRRWKLGLVAEAWHDD
mgnify:CR=1 FL=1